MVIHQHYHINEGMRGILLDMIEFLQNLSMPSN